MNTFHQLRSIRFLVLTFIISLFISGLTALPVEAELAFLERQLANSALVGEWIRRVKSAYTEVNNLYPFLFYGYDWLAFAHFVLAILFVGPYRDPIRNVWVIQFGMIACVLVIPFAFIAGYVRGIPIGWRLIDCSFGVFGFAMLQAILNRIRKIEPLIAKIYTR